MKYILLIAYVVCTAYADHICQIGDDIQCKVNCLARGYRHGGHCSDEKNCLCITQEEDSPQPKASLTCLLGGDVTCKIKCLTSHAHLQGYCDENNNCRCDGKPTNETELNTTYSRELKPKTELICLLGGDLACEINCFSTNGHFLGHCNENKDCICKAKPSEAKDTRGLEVPKPKTELICLLGGDLACEINCFSSNGHFLGHCDDNKDCKCEGRPTKPEARNNLICILGGSSACKTHCRQSGQSGHCDSQKICRCYA